MKFIFQNIYLFLSFFIIFFSCNVVSSQSNHVIIKKENNNGFVLEVDGRNFIVNGMNWDFIPIGKNAVNSNFWGRSDELIKEGLSKEMSLLKDMNVNVIRQYSEIPPKWIQYIFENYGIYTMLNHSFGRYGLLINDTWEPITDYSNLDSQKILLTEIKKLAHKYKNTPGLLMYLLGNENNYGLFWAGSETENFPEKEKQQVIGKQRGRPMYKLMNSAAKILKDADPNHPVAICNGDLLFIDIVAEECKDVDVFGVNSYRGASFTDLFKTVKETLNKPLLFTEFGADAFNVITNKEDQQSQAYYLLENWKEIYENSAGIGKYENSIGGFTFQFSDGWWKYDFDHRKNETIHDKIATWKNGGYSYDLMEGKNNMNEEWFGICSKGFADEKGMYDLYPRAAYYVLQHIHQLNFNKKKISLKDIQEHFNKINLADAFSKGMKQQKALYQKNEKTTFPPLKSIKKTAASLFEINFDHHFNSQNFIPFNGASFQIIQNPEISGINSTASNVGVIINSGSNWEGGYFDLIDPLNLVDGNKIKLKAFSKKPVSFLLKLEEGENKAAFQEFNLKHNGSGWEELTFIFSSKNQYKRVAIFIDGSGTSSGVFYIDDIIQSN